MLRSARRYSQAAYTTLERRVEGMTREEATTRFQGKIILLARQVAERLPPESPLDVEDLVSYGAIGLLEAFERYDDDRGILFSTFAEYRIRGAMLDALRSNDTFTRRRRQLAKRIDAATHSLRASLGREPTPVETAAKLDISIEQYWESIDRVKPISLVSIDGLMRDGESEDSRTLSERITSGIADDPSHRMDIVEVKDALKATIMSLPEKERHCIMMYYGKDLSLAEIAEVFEVSPSRISQIISQAKGKLRKRLRASVDPADVLGGLDR